MNNLIRKYVLPILATSVCIAGVITLSGCSGSDGNPASGTIESAGGTAALEIRVGKVGTLAKQATISMEKLIRDMVQPLSRKPLPDLPHLKSIPSSSKLSTKPEK
jgi:hypothetical protein